MRKTKIDNKSDLDPYEDLIRSAKLDLYEALIKEGMIHEQKKKDIQ